MQGLSAWKGCERLAFKEFKVNFVDWNLLTHHMQLAYLTLSVV